MRTLAAFESLRNRTFARLSAAQTISLFGDALTWVGLALLAFDLDGRDGSSTSLGTALTLRVTAFVVPTLAQGTSTDLDGQSTLPGHPPGPARVAVRFLDNQSETRTVTIGGDTNLTNVYIGYLRRELADAGCDTAIETVRRVGYCYAPAESLGTEPLGAPGHG